MFYARSNCSLPNVGLGSILTDAGSTDCGCYFRYSWKMQNTITFLTDVTKSQLDYHNNEAIHTLWGMYEQYTGAH